MNELSAKGKLKKHTKPWYARWWVWIILLFVLAYIIPNIINCAFMIGYIENKSPNTSFTSDQLLIFYGTILSFGGTIFLGAVALIQNNRMEKLTKDSVQLQKDQNCLQLFSPRFKIFEAMNKLLLDLINERYSDSDEYKKMIHEYQYASNGVKFLLGNEIFSLGRELINLAHKMNNEYRCLNKYKNVDKLSEPADQQIADNLFEKYFKLQEQLILEWVDARKIEIAFEKYIDIKNIKAKEE